MDPWADMGDDGLMTESGGEPEMKATRLRSSVARRLDWELASEFLEALDVVMEGSVADARSSLGLRALQLRVDDSLLAMGRDSDGEAMSTMLVLEDNLRVSTFDVCPRKPG